MLTNAGEEELCAWIVVVCVQGSVVVVLDEFVAVGDMSVVSIASLYGPRLRVVMMM